MPGAAKGPSESAAVSKLAGWCIADLRQQCCRPTSAVLLTYVGNTLGCVRWCQLYLSQASEVP